MHAQRPRNLNLWIAFSLGTLLGVLGTYLGYGNVAYAQFGTTTQQSKAVQFISIGNKPDEFYVLYEDGKIQRLKNTILPEFPK